MADAPKNITNKPGVDTDESDSDVVKDHIALQNQSSVKAEDYPSKTKKDASLTRKP